MTKGIWLPAYDSGVDELSSTILYFALTRMHVTEDMKPRSYPVQLLSQVRASQVNFTGRRQIQDPVRRSMRNQNVDIGGNAFPALNQLVWWGKVGKAGKVRAPG